MEGRRVSCPSAGEELGRWLWYNNSSNISTQTEYRSQSVESQTLKHTVVMFAHVYNILCHRESVLWTVIKALQRVSKLLAKPMLLLYTLVVVMMN